jgi:hypothetical protein
MGRFIKNSICMIFILFSKVADSNRMVNSSRIFRSLMTQKERKR